MFSSPAVYTILHPCPWSCVTESVSDSPFPFSTTHQPFWALQPSWPLGFHPGFLWLFTNFLLCMLLLLHPSHYSQAQSIFYFHDPVISLSFSKNLFLKPYSSRRLKGKIDNRPFSFIFILPQFIKCKGKTPRRKQNSTNSQTVFI